MPQVHRRSPVPLLSVLPQRLAEGAVDLWLPAVGSLNSGPLRRIRGKGTRMFFDQVTIPGEIDIIDLRLAFCPFRLCLYKRVIKVENYEG